MLRYTVRNDELFRQLLRFTALIIAYMRVVRKLYRSHFGKTCKRMIATDINMGRKFVQGDKFEVVFRKETGHKLFRSFGDVDNADLAA